MNEAESLPHLIDRIEAELSSVSFELVLVDDGSSDNSVAVILSKNRPWIKLVVLNRNFGQTTAMNAGIDHAQGDFIATLDGDLQNDPADILPMLERLEKEGWDVVAGRRKNRKDGALLRKLPSRIANALIRKLTGVYVHDYGCTLKVFRKQIAQNLGLYGQLHRFIPVLAKIQGARITEMDVRHHARQFGKSKYGIGRTLKVMSDLILILFLQKYLQRPIHLFGPVGLGCLMTGMGICFYLLIEKILGADIGGRPLLTLGVVFFLGGVQLLSVGLVAEMLTRTYYESQQKPTYGVNGIYQGSDQIG